MDVAVKNNLIDTLVISQDSFVASREKAKQILEKSGLPAPKAEEYKFTPITRLLEKNFQSLAPRATSSTIAIDDFLIENLEANVIVFVNGVLNKKHTNIISANLIIESIVDAYANNQSLIDKHFTTHAAPGSDTLVALNTAMWNHGTFIKVSANNHIDRPIVIYNLTDAASGEIVTACRNLIILEKGSSLTLIEKYDSIGSQNFSSTVNEVVVEEEASFTYKLIQNDHGQRFQFNHTTIYQEANSHVNCFTLSLKGKLIRNNLQLILDGEHCDSHMYGLYLLNGDTLADNHTVVDHKKPNSISNELYKGVMDGNSKGVFNGKIFVRPDAQKTNAFQSNRNIILSDKASVNTKPQLEIWADDVKCSHGCTSGQLDEEALFYLRSRGIGKDIARALLLYAYAGEVIDKIKNDAIRTYVDALVSERLHKNF
jgi:Fe-S cluster assembly protein SufD